MCADEQVHQLVGGYNGMFRTILRRPRLIVYDELPLSFRNALHAYAVRSMMHLNQRSRGAVTETLPPQQSRHVHREQCRTHTSCVTCMSLHT